MDEMGDCKDSAKKNAYTTDDNVSDTEERVTSSHDSAGTDDDGLGALVKGRIEIYILSVTMPSTKRMKTHGHQ